MNEELAEFDMCKLRVRDLELVINKWRTEVKNILDNPIISKTNKLVECKENYLNMILNKIQTKVVEKVSKDEAVLINTNYLKVINKINNLKNRFLYINQKILEDILNTENDIAMTKQIIDNLKNKVLYDKDIKLFRKPISKNLLNKIIYDGYDVSGLKDNNETDIQLYNYKKLLKISEYLCDAGLRKITLWVRAEIARKIFSFKNFSNKEERYYYTYVIHDYDINLTDYLNIKDKNRTFIISTKKLMKSINTGLGYNLLDNICDEKMFNLMDDLIKIEEVDTIDFCMIKKICQC